MVEKARMVPDPVKGLSGNDTGRAAGKFPAGPAVMCGDELMDWSADRME